MNCAYCKEPIDNDSRYCDQCGQEVKLCPDCRRTGKGKMCTSCGKPLVLLAQIAPQPAVEKEVPVPSDNTGTIRLPVETPTIRNPVLKLINKNLNHDLVIEDNTIIGRNTGPHVSLFASFNQVSGKHCSFKYDPEKGWLVTDLGSTNGTMLNNQKVAPNVPAVLCDKSYLKIANIEYYVAIS